MFEGCIAARLNFCIRCFGGKSGLQFFLNFQRFSFVALQLLFLVRGNLKKPFQTKKNLCALILHKISFKIEESYQRRKDGFSVYPDTGCVNGAFLFFDHFEIKAVCKNDNCC